MRLNSKILILSIFLLCLWVSLTAFEKGESCPKTEISNKQLTMKLYLPDAEKGYYQGTRFDWSGVVYSLEFKGHQYFGEWNPGTDSKIHDHITGPVESFGTEGMGYEEAAVGNGFLRIGVGMLQKENNEPYIWNRTYKILDPGKWTINQGKDWIEFVHLVISKSGWGYRYTKKISLTNDTPGFKIYHKLENTGQKRFVTNQYNHNFFVIDGTKTGPDFSIEFPFEIASDEGDDKSKKLVEVHDNKLQFRKYFEDESAYLNLNGFTNEVANHQFKIINTKTGAGVQLKMDKPLCKMVFWANPNTLCPENFVCLDIAPEESEIWEAEYSLFIKKIE